MFIQEMIRKKRSGLELDLGDLDQFFTGYLHGDVMDYQMSAMLMAIYFQGMSLEETIQLTQLSKHSGHVFEWDGIDKNLIIDKHSTGGVGDKTSLILSPLCILEGLKVPMISGRSLGHTGGTVDKLESIPGMNMNLSVPQAQAQLREFGGFMMCQTESLAPLDKRLYSLRDSCSVVNAPSLVTSSILSKKLAEGLSGLVLDVKYGSGAFFSAQKDAENLAKLLIEVGSRCGLSMRVVLSSMNNPLGRSAGNALEVYECVQVMRGEGPLDTYDLSLTLAAEMVQLAFPERSMAQILDSLKAHIASGRAYEVFSKLLALQGADSSFVEHPEKLLQAKHQIAVYPETSGFVTSIDVKALGLVVNLLGGGRARLGDPVDPQVGLSELKHVGEHVSAEEPLAFVHARDENSVETIRKILQNSFVIKAEAPLEKESLIWKTY